MASPFSTGGLYRLRRRLGHLFRAACGQDLVRRRELSVPMEVHGCDPCSWAVKRGVLGPDSIVYSFGIGEDVSFDRSLIDRYRLVVHAFDPTPRSLAWLRGQSLPRELVVHEVGLAAVDGELVLAPPPRPEWVSYSAAGSEEVEGSIRVPVRRLSTLMRELGHDRLDLLKIDIEGAEYDVLADILESRIVIQQLLVEFHHRFPRVGVGRTRTALEQLSRAGFRIFWISASGEEYGFACG